MSYHPAIQKVIRFIENNLETEMNGELLAMEAGFSFFHFHRIFRHETGMTIAEYIRMRRLARAAVTILSTDERILDIALRFGFESQEAFSRAFKKVYNLPPGRYRKLMGRITDKEEEFMTQLQNKESNSIKGWFLSGSHPSCYEMGIDRQVVHQGTGSGYLRSVTVDSHEQFATMMQMFKAGYYLGKRIRLSAFVKTREVDEGYTGLWMRVDTAAGDILQFDNMSNRQLKGTLDWNHYSIVLDVPPQSAAISFGVLLAGRGQVWVDRFSFEEVPETVPSTNLEISGELLDEPTNLSFEEV
ncbi:helix-turn-helix domain-containing protein [Paenibacillus terreus]|uniref:Helix-turn-helix domain-containing protein n=1 Tax=Paenibacillus terreus TaxID=1387834 RepID=A0ABV5B231_9BACL